MVHFGHRRASADCSVVYKGGIASALAIFTIALAMIGGGALFKHRNTGGGSVPPSLIDHGEGGVLDATRYKTNLAPNGPATSTSTSTP